MDQNNSNNNNDGNIANKTSTQNTSNNPLKPSPIPTPVKNDVFIKQEQVSSFPQGTIISSDDSVKQTKTILIKSSTEKDEFSKQPGTIPNSPQQKPFSTESIIYDDSTSVGGSKIMSAGPLPKDSFIKRSALSTEEDEVLIQSKVTTNSTQQQKSSSTQTIIINNDNLVGGTKSIPGGLPVKDSFVKQTVVITNNSQQKPLSSQSASGNPGGSNLASANQSANNGMGKQPGVAPSGSQQKPFQAGAASSGGSFKQSGSPLEEDDFLEEPKLVSNSAQQQKPFSPQSA
ncbi:MAG: hypothetical protein LBV22_01830, partial [Mycoplasmataceae bacterium]|nr:hypothetical protein [Mycoplasmataceae bacterium]